MDLAQSTAGKWCFSCEREPERFAQRINVGAHVERGMFKLFRTGERRRTHESVMGQRLQIRSSVNCLSQTKVDYFHYNFLTFSVGASTQRGGYRSMRGIVATALCRRAGCIAIRFAIGREEHQVC